MRTITIISQGSRLACLVRFCLVSENLITQAKPSQAKQQHDKITMNVIEKKNHGLVSCDVACDLERQSKGFFPMFSDILSESLCPAVLNNEGKTTAVAHSNVLSFFFLFIYRITLH